MKYLSLIILSAFCMWGCKEKKQVEKPKWVEKWDSVMTEATPFIDSVWEISPTETTTHHVDKEPSGKIRLHGGDNNQKGTTTYALSVDISGNIIDTIPKKDTTLNWSKFREDMNRLGELQYEADLSTISRLAKKGELSPYETVEIIRAHCGASNWYNHKKIDSLEKEIQKLK